MSKTKVILFNMSDGESHHSPLVYKLRYNFEYHLPSSDDLIILNVNPLFSDVGALAKFVYDESNIDDKFFIVSAGNSAYIANELAGHMHAPLFCINPELDRLRPMLNIPSNRQRHVDTLWFPMEKDDVNFGTPVHVKSRCLTFNNVVQVIKYILED